MNVQVSQAFVNLLSEYGFIEKTAKFYPEHHNRLKQMGEYDPDNVKRLFVKGRLHILFDYIRISMTYNSAAAFYWNSRITINQLVSVLYFSKCDTKQRQYLKKYTSRNDLTRIYDELQKDVPYQDSFRPKTKILYVYHLKEIEKLKESISKKL